MEDYLGHLVVHEAARTLKSTLNTDQASQLKVRFIKSA
jgi:hypothetical protein